MVPSMNGLSLSIAIEPGSVIELSALSLVPDDAEDGWDHETLEAYAA